jgi:3-dehydroquinate synthase class II
LEAQWKELELQVQVLEIQSDSLKKDNQKLENMLLNSKTTISNLRKNLDEYKIALESNKEDTGYIVALFADAQNEIKNLEEYIAQLERSKTKLKNTRITAGIMAGAGIGMYFCANLIQDNEKIKAALKGCGIGVAASGGILLGVSFLF